ncbi:G protein-coupled receptor gpr1 [Knufia obscura]|uniref:G protein-coupled receptor gpr1 n=2 Tax=Knufia TaxID=430999 RepID=A0AAN8I6K1_9EURO|nr:G protein-coupled receptor gpr1 [Knufia obscura]KAK5951981.1 G protein-coupled receptor gpr1 [Knufia fluminis]
MGIEASDFAILMIALHAILYIFHPPARSGESGGLYRWRKIIYPAWGALPILAASLAFVNSGNAYTTAGTFCYLPRRPFWYRLALAWIPRYCILSLIFLMYAALYIYVTVKFRSFSNLQDSDSNVTTNSNSRRSSRRSSTSDDGIAPDEPNPIVETPKVSKFNRPTFSRSGSYNKDVPQKPVDPWDEVSFITAKPLRDTSSPRPGVQTSDFAWNVRDTSYSGTTSLPSTRKLSHQLDPLSPGGRKASNCPTMNSRYTGDTMTNSPQAHAGMQEEAEAPRKEPQPPARPMQAKTKDPLRRTRKAIRKQLRYMFVYPAVYVLMWAFPFASHCLLYNDYYVTHPVYWLTIVSTCMFSLQAGVDCIVFSWREKPWRRIPEGHKFSVDGLRASFSGRLDQGASRPAKGSAAFGRDVEHGGNGRAPQESGSGSSSRVASAHWWEAEGLKRKDSVWMGTDSSHTGNTLPSRRDTLTSPHVAEDDQGERALSVVHEHRRSMEDEGGVKT